VSIALTLRNQTALQRLLLAAPLIFIAHFVEEGPAFVAWVNSHVARGITVDLFYTVNYSALAISIVVVALEWGTSSAVSVVLAAAWFGFLFFANALLHVTGAIHDRAYVPGLVTAVLFYLPFYALLFARLVETRRVRTATLTVACIVSAIPMLVHGYLIIFRGSRLF
jgi:hypothetical protein